MGRRWSQHGTIRGSPVVSLSIRMCRDSTAHLSRVTLSWLLMASRNSCMAILPTRPITWASANCMRPRIRLASFAVNVPRARIPLTVSETSVTLPGLFLTRTKPFIDSLVSISTPRTVAIESKGFSLWSANWNPSMSSRSLAMLIEDCFNMQGATIGKSSK